MRVEPRARVLLMGYWIGSKWCYTEKEIKAIVDLGPHTRDERIDYCLAKKVLKKRRLAITRENIARFLGDKL